MLGATKLVEALRNAVVVGAQDNMPCLALGHGHVPPKGQRQEAFSRYGAPQQQQKPQRDAPRKSVVLFLDCK